MNKFKELNLPKELLSALDNMQFTSPMPIQSQAIPVVFEGKDILATAQTGTGKTAAFMLPIISRLMVDRQKTALVITPTREIAMQVMAFTRNLIQFIKPQIKTALLVGGNPIVKQFHYLRSNPSLIIGTPGRVNDHLKRKSLKLDKAKFLVLDEADRMLDMGFGVQIEEILNFMPSNYQTLMFSATLPNEILKITEKYLNTPERIAVDKVDSPAKNIKQDTIYVSQKEKYTVLLDQLEQRDGSIIVFAGTKAMSERLAESLKKDFQSADFLHGDLRQSQRTKVTKAFRNQKFRIIVATDVAARGLDIPHIQHVINFDLPQNAEDYIHRIGRTARAGVEGEALSLITPQDQSKWNAIQRFMNPEKKNVESKARNRRFHDRKQTQKRRRVRSR